MNIAFSESEGKAVLFDQAHVLFHRACSQHAERVAIEFGEYRLSYQDLLNRVEAICDLLLTHDAGQGKIVAICGERSPDVVACCIAVWAVGSIVLLIDSSIPAQRRDLMLASVSTSAAVLCDSFADSAVQPADLPAISLRQARPAGGSFRFENQEDDHAYIAFTSGSTGKPKAIIGSHNGLSHFLSWQRHEFAVEPGERFAHFTNLSFDVWFRDALTPLISGATVCIPTFQHLSGQAVFDFLRSNRITATHVVPSIANLWINTHEPKATLEDLKHAFFAGEPLEGVLVRKWKEAFPNCQVVNLYGPTETTLAKHFKRIDDKAPDGVQSVGVNIPGAMSYILAEDGKVCAPGQSGEICIATPYRSHGYWAEQGLVSPFVKGLIPNFPGLLLYRTGDFGRRNKNNEIEINWRFRRDCI